MEDGKPRENLYKIFSKESFLYKGVQASGDNPVSCRLCGKEGNLHSFSETYNTKEGVVQRYSQLVNKCFGVEVKPSDELVCTKCIYQLHITERFRAQVVDAFAAPSGLPDQSKEKTPKSYVKKKSTVDLVKKVTEANIDRKWRFQRKSLFNLNIQPKRMNLYCTLCRQRYPMMVPFEGWKEFVCSRCKKNNKPHLNPINNRNISTSILKDRFELRTLTDMRGKRQFSFNKKPQFSRGDLTTSKFQLVRPIRFESRTSQQCCNDFRCNICGKDMKTWDLLNRHMRTHTGEPLYRCDVCRRVFKERTLFQKHYLSHGKDIEKKVKYNL